MAYITVWNHGSAAQRRPVQFTVPLGLSWGNLLEVGSERMIAEKQYEDGIDAVYVCPPPTNGWRAGQTDHTVTAYSGNNPQYLFKFAEPFAGPFQCGTPQEFNDRFLPTLRVYRTGSDPQPIEARLHPLLPWSQGPDAINGGFIPNGGTRRRVFASQASADGWHMYFYITFDAELAVAEFAAEVIWSDETMANTLGTGTNAWRTLCSHIELSWDNRTSVKAKFNTEGIQVVGGNSNVMRMSTTFTPGDPSPSTYRYRSWDGVWVGQTGWVLRGFLLARQDDGSSTTFSDTEFTNAAPLYAVIDAESWDGHWLGGGSSGHGTAMVDTTPQVGPNWSDTSKHFCSWNRGAGGRGDNIGMVLNNQPKDPGSQGNFGVSQGHSVLMRRNSPRDLEAAAHDLAKRQHYIFRAGVKDLNGGNVNIASGYYWTPEGFVDIPSCNQRQVQLSLLNGRPTTDRLNWPFGRTTADADENAYPCVGFDSKFFGMDNQHFCCPSQTAAFRITKDPMTWHMLHVFLQQAWLSDRRRQWNGSDLTGDREIGRKFYNFAGIWKAAPGLRHWLMDIVYGPTYGFYEYDSTPGNEGNLPKGVFGNSALFFLRKDQALNEGPANISRDINDIPNWIKKPEGRFENTWDRSQFRYGDGPENSFGDVSGVWSFLGGAGLVVWHDTLVATNGGGYLDITKPPVTDFKEWGEIALECCIDWGISILDAGGGATRTQVTYHMMVYRSGHQLLPIAGGAGYYPPNNPPFPFYTEANPLHQYCTNAGGPSLATWGNCGLNWYRQFGRNASYRARAQALWEAGIKSVNGGVLTNGYNSWVQLFFDSSAPLYKP